MKFYIKIEKMKKVHGLPIVERKDKFIVDGRVYSFNIGDPHFVVLSENSVVIDTEYPLTIYYYKGGQLYKIKFTMPEYIEELEELIDELEKLMDKEMIMLVLRTCNVLGDIENLASKKDP